MQISYANVGERHFAYELEIRNDVSVLMAPLSRSGKTGRKKKRKGFNRAAGWIQTSII